MNAYANQKWIELYYAALVERRRISILARVEEARIEIADRLSRLGGTVESSEERGAINDALSALNAVEREANLEALLPEGPINHHRAELT
jgi:hypothetical protein